MAFVETTDTYASTGAAMLAFKTALVASGAYTITKTYDGASFDEGDILTTAGDFDGAGAFFLASMTGGPQFLFTSIDPTQWNIATSIVADFSGGGVGVPPTATDQGTSPSFVGFAIFPGAGAFDAGIGVEGQAPWRWFLHLVATDFFISSAGAVGGSGRPLLIAGAGIGVGFYTDFNDADVWIAAHEAITGTQEAGAGGDVTAPTVTLISPPEGDTTRTTPIVIEVTDASAFAGIFAWVVYPTGATEVIHDSDGFTAMFAGISTRATIAGGYRYTIRRAGGWLADPTIRFRPIDAAGNTP